MVDKLPPQQKSSDLNPLLEIVEIGKIIHYTLEPMVTSPSGRLYILKNIQID